MSFNIYRFSLFLIFIFGISCTKDDDPVVDNPSPPVFILSELKTSDGTGIEQVYKYTFDTDENLIQISQNNPINTPEQENLYDLIYDSSGNLSSITLKIGGNLVNTFPVVKEANRISYKGFGATSLDFYFDENSLITSKERVFESNTTVIDYNYNNLNQLQKIVFQETPPAVVDTFDNYDTETPIFFFSEFINPIEDFITLYVFDLKYSLIGKPTSNTSGTINYSYDNELLSRIEFDSGSSMSFKYIDISK